MVVSELRGEKIDIIPYNDEPARFVAKALSPARVREVLVDDDAKQATVIVPDDQLSLAIGREGQNARLAARLTGWRVDIRSETEFAAEEAEHGYEEEEIQGRCAAILSNGRRCPTPRCRARATAVWTPTRRSRIAGDNIADLTARGRRGAGRRRPRDPRCHRRRTPAPSSSHSRSGGEQPGRSAAWGSRGAGAIGAHVPRRRCVGCGRVAPKSELVRLAVASGEDSRRKRAVWTSTGQLPGRGAYLCRASADSVPAAACLALATRRGGLARALRYPVTLS